MTRFHGGIRWVLLASLLILLLPVALAPMQSTAALEKFHNRRLHPWPPIASFGADPAAYMHAATLWLGDRVWPIADVSAFQKQALYYVFRTPPQKRVTLGDHGHVFFNGASEAGLFALFENNCVGSHSESAARALEAGLDSFAKFAAEFHAEARVLIVPMASTVLARHLPRSVPQRLRTACVAVGSGTSPIFALAKRRRDVVFPFAEVAAGADDPAFFPAGNYHPVGLSIKAVRDAYFAANELSPAPGDKLTRIERPSEILSSYGIKTPYPAYDLSNASVVSDDAAADAMAGMIKDLFNNPVTVRAYRTKGQPDERAALMLSDSIGYATSVALASGYGRFTWVYANGIKDGKVRELITRLEARDHYATLIIAGNEGATGQIGAWLTSGAQAK